MSRTAPRPTATSPGPIRSRKRVRRSRKRVWTVGLLAAGLIALGVLGGSLVVVAAPPAEELGDATEALAEARQLDAEELAPESFERAERLLEQGRAEMTRQEQEVLPLRNHLEARRLLREAEDAAVDAATRATEGAATLRQAAEERVDAAERAVETAEDLVEQAPRGLDTKHELRAARGDLALLHDDLDRARESFAEGAHREARERAADVEQDALRLAELIDRSMTPRI